MYFSQKPMTKKGSPFLKKVDATIAMKFEAV